jgi:hypothetical protein
MILENYCTQQVICISSMTYLSSKYHLRDEVEFKHGMTVTVSLRLKDLLEVKVGVNFSEDG